MTPNISDKSTSLIPQGIFPQAIGFLYAATAKITAFVVSFFVSPETQGQTHVESSLQRSHGSSLFKRTAQIGALIGLVILLASTQPKFLSNCLKMAFKPQKFSRSIREKFHDMIQVRDSIQTANPSNYLMMATKAQEFVNTNIIFSSSFPNRNIHYTAHDRETADKMFSYIGGNIRIARSSFQGAQHSNFIGAIITGMNALKYSIGNCMEMSALAFVYLLMSYPNVKMDLFSIQGYGGDHCFFVIGRDFDSDPADYKTWGENALICDTWLKKNFLPSNIENDLKNYACVGDDGYPLLNDFNPKVQDLELWASNQLTVKDLKSLAGPNPSLEVNNMIEKLTPLLLSFYNEQNLAKKQETAKDIQKFLVETPSSSKSFRTACADLYDQLEFFLDATNCTSS